MCATCSELPSYISTMVEIYKEMDKRVKISKKTVSYPEPGQLFGSGIKVETKEVFLEG